MGNKCGGNCGGCQNKKISLDKQVDDILEKDQQIRDKLDGVSNDDTNLWLAFVYLLVIISVGFGIFSALCSKSAHADTAGIGTYSDGYRMGVINKFSIKGVFVKSAEGEMLMGRDSSKASYKDGKTTKVINPWAFSVSKTMSNNVSAAGGDYVWVRYTQAQFHNSAEYDTDYLIQEVRPVTRQNPTDCELTPKPNNLKSDGFRIGRMVKVSQKGTVNKSYETTMQVGNSGNQFQDMGISDSKMYECAVNVLKSGKQVKVYYDQSFFRNILSSDTTYTIWKIETMKDI